MFERVSVGVCACVSLCRSWCCVDWLVCHVSSALLLVVTARVPKKILKCRAVSREICFYSEVWVPPQAPPPFLSFSTHTRADVDTFSFSLVLMVHRPTPFQEAIENFRLEQRVLFKDQPLEGVRHHLNQPSLLPASCTSPPPLTFTHARSRTRAHTAACCL